MSNLHRNYRPQKFADVLGQKHIKVVLQNELSSNTLAQAFLFCGPRAVGKTTLARVLAKAANCQNRQPNEFEPCGKCSSCEAIEQNKHIDVIEIDAASNTGVDNVRDNIISFSRLAPSLGKYRVFIIDEVHMLSINAFNALLKIIEEPPAHIIFILATTEANKVPATIASRCERFDFKKIPLTEIIKKLEFIASQEKKQLEPEIFQIVARHSDGHLRDAETLLSQVFALGSDKISLKEAELILPYYNSQEAITLIEFLLEQDVSQALSLVNNVVNTGVNIDSFVAELITILRKIVLTKVSSSLADELNLNLGDELELQINQVLKKIDLEKALRYLDRILVLLKQKNQLLSQLPLELAIIELSQSQIKTQPQESLSDKTKTTTEPQAVVTTTTKPVEEKSKKTGTNLNLDCEAIAQKWPEFLVNIKKHNHSLALVLQNCQAQGLEQGELLLKFKYRFHEERINTQEIKHLVEKGLSEVYGSQITIKTEIQEDLELNQTEIEAETESDPINEQSVEAKSAEGKNKPIMLEDLLSTFGGEIIN